MRKFLAAPLFAALAVAACSSDSNKVKPLPTPPAAAADEVDIAFAQLMRGDEAGARKRLSALLKRQPANVNAQLLSDSIARDPKDLLGPQNHPYTVRDGDTLVTLAERFLGNRLKAYQLLRYNGLAAPSALTAGQVVRIPGEAPRPEPVRRPEPAPTPARVPTPARTGAARPHPAPAAPATNPAAAQRLRTAGLAALNQGAVDRAIGLLRRAAQFDPANPVIARDLARAERIGATVRARK